MDTWEYKFHEPLTQFSNLEAELNQFGAEGWEVVAMAGDSYGWFKIILKRRRSPRSADVPN